MSAKPVKSPLPPSARTVAVLFAMVRLLAFASVLFCVGCAGGKPWMHSKAGDPAHPAAALDVQGASAPMRLAVGGESRQVQLQGNDSLVLTGTAEDKGGVKDMILQ